MYGLALGQPNSESLPSPGTTVLPRLTHPQAAVDVEHRAGNVPGFLACQEHDRRRHFRAGPHTSERHSREQSVLDVLRLSLIHISEPTRLGMISYAVFC